MKLVVGLGNPGDRYAGTRHNIGFDVLDQLARKRATSAVTRKFSAELRETTVNDERIMLVAPQTFMNLSGQSVQQIVKFFQVDLRDLLVVCDDMNLNVGQLRLRASGSAGGQKGLQNIIQLCGSEAIPRLRIGIGRPPGQMEATNYVLGRYRPEERVEVEISVVEAACGIEDWVRSGIDFAMNRVNRATDPPPKPKPPATKLKLDRNKKNQAAEQPAQPNDSEQENSSQPDKSSGTPSPD